MRIAIGRHGPHGLLPDDDEVAVEAPLEIRLGWRQAGALVERPIAVTMRTPGHDGQLALGFLFAEGVIDGLADVEQQADDVVTVRLPEGVEPDLHALERHLLTTSACGVCGRSSLAGLPRGGRVEDRLRLAPELILQLPGRLRQAQPGFTRTGGTHATGIFNPAGVLVTAHEDVGRHNALDKAIGQLLDHTPLSGHIACVSGRASWELVQKALRAGLSALVAVGAPSSAAVTLAEQGGLTLVGFCRAGGFNVYTGAWRLAPMDGQVPPA